MFNYHIDSYYKTDCTINRYVFLHIYESWKKTKNKFRQIYKRIMCTLNLDTKGITTMNYNLFKKKKKKKTRWPGKWYEMTRTKIWDKSSRRRWPGTRWFWRDKSRNPSDVSLASTPTLVFSPMIMRNIYANYCPYSLTAFHLQSAFMSPLSVT